MQAKGFKTYAESKLQPNSHTHTLTSQQQIKIILLNLVRMDDVSSLASHEFMLY